MSVKVRAEKFAEKRIEIEIKPEPEVTEVVFDLLPASRSTATGEVAGVVRGPDGGPVGGATVWLVPDGSDGSAETNRSVSNTDGAFRFVQINPGNYLVVAERANLAPAWVRAAARPSATGIVVKLSDGVEVLIVPEGTDGPLSFRVIDDAGVPLVDDVRSGRQRFGSGASITLAPGRYRVEALCPHYKTGRAEFVASPGSQVKVALKRAGK